MTGKSLSYVPISVSGRTVSDSDIGEGSHFVQRLLDKLCQQSMDCARLVEELYQTQVPKEGAASTSKKGKSSVDKEERYGKLLTLHAGCWVIFMFFFVVCWL